MKKFLSGALAIALAWSPVFAATEFEFRAPSDNAISGTIDTATDELDMVGGFKENGSDTLSNDVSGNAGTASALAANGANCAASSFPLGVDASGAVESCSTSISGNSATATALAANGANCTAGQYPLGVDASGAVESCTADVNTNAQTICSGLESLRGDGTCVTPSASGGVVSSSFTRVPQTTFSNTLFGVAHATVTVTTDSDAVTLIYTGPLTQTVAQANARVSFLIDGDAIASAGNCATGASCSDYTLQVAVNNYSGIGATTGYRQSATVSFPVGGLTPGSHSFAVMFNANTGVGGFYSTAPPRFGVTY